jgi:hypothetical protein
MRYNSRRTGIYASGAEKVVAENLASLGVEATHESAKLDYVQHRRYTPDFTIGNHHIEAKGWWPSADRAKLLSVIHCNPGALILVVLENPNLTLSKKSKTTYAQWCDRHGIRWCGIPIPSEILSQWLGQPISPAQGQTAIAAMAPHRTQMDLFSASFARGDIAQMAPTGKVP